MQFQKYDALGRKVLGGIKTGIGTTSRATLQTAFDGTTTETYEETGTGLLGYTNRSFPTAYAVLDADVKLVNYYDDYSWNSDVNYTFQSGNAFHAQGLAKGLMTGKLFRNVKTNTWQKMVMYYDYKGRIIQDFHLSNLNKLIRKDYQYRFNGELLKTRIVKGSIAKLFSYEYDHLGHKISFVHNGKPIVKYFYDNIGRLQSKRFSPAGTTQGSKQTGNWTDASSWLSGTLPTLSDNVTINTGQTLTIPNGQSAFAGVLNDKGILKNFGTLNMGKVNLADLYLQTFKYHIRGGLTGINTDANNNLTNNLFSYKLAYEDGTNGGYFDGNIRNQYWKSSIEGIQRAYQYSYDGASRLKEATFASTKANENYALNSVSYDDNGNIKTLSRSGATNSNFTSFGNVDNLNYTYQSNSNKLSKIQDLTTSNTDLGDFRDGTNTDDDYEYWLDGSLKKDKNKKIASITYNYLKFPETLTFDNGRTITTEYDAEGTKLKKIDSNGETTDYEEEDIYVNGGLYQTSHDEGRIVKGVYEYNINDHLGNLRMAFRDSLGIAVPTQSIFYDPWGLSMKGMSITRNSLNFNKHQFLNRETQFETGYIDLQNRQYDPQRGQMTSIDALAELSRRFSPFVYGNNNGLRFIDPDGMASQEVKDFNGRTHTVGDDDKTTIYQAPSGNVGEDDKDKGKKEAKNSLKIPTIDEARSKNGLNPHGDGIQSDHTIESIIIPIFRPLGWAFNALKLKFLVSVAAKEGEVGLYTGVKSASKYLQEQGVPRAFRQQILQSFEIETISLRTADNATYGLRFFGGAANETGRYLFPTFTNYTNRAGLGLPPSWNSMTGLAQFQVTEGSTYIFGRAVSQGGIYTGGSHQMFVNSLKNLTK